MYQHPYKCCLPSSILPKHNNDLRISEFTLSNLKREIALSFDHSWISISCIRLNFLGTFLWCLSNLYTKK